HIESDINNNILAHGHRCERLHFPYTTLFRSKSSSCSYRCTATCNMCWTTNGNTHSERCDNLCLDSVHSIEFNNRFTGDSESDFNNNIQGDGNRFKRIYCIKTSDGECKSAACS